MPMMSQDHPGNLHLNMNMNMNFNTNNMNNANKNLKWDSSSNPNSNVNIFLEYKGEQEELESRRKRCRHSKSRNGCTSCKHHRVKCDEAKPTCGNCERKNRECIYLQPVTKPRSRANVTETADVERISPGLRSNVSVLRFAPSSGQQKHQERGPIPASLASSSSSASSSVSGLASTGSLQPPMAHTVPVPVTNDVHSNNHNHIVLEQQHSQPHSQQHNQPHNHQHNHQQPLYDMNLPLPSQGYDMASGPVQGSIPGHVQGNVQAPVPQERPIFDDTDFDCGVINSSESPNTSSATSLEAITDTNVFTGQLEPATVSQGYIELANEPYYTVPQQVPLPASDLEDKQVQEEIPPQKHQTLYMGMPGSGNSLVRIPNEYDETNQNRNDTRNIAMDNAILKYMHITELPLPNSYFFSNASRTYMAQGCQQAVLYPELELIYNYTSFSNKFIMCDSVDEVMFWRHAVTRAAFASKILMDCLLGATALYLDRVSNGSKNLVPYATKKFVEVVAQFIEHSSTADIESLFHTSCILMIMAFDFVDMIPLAESDCLDLIVFVKSPLSLAHHSRCLVRATGQGNINPALYKRFDATANSKGSPANPILRSLLRICQIMDENDMLKPDRLQLRPIVRNGILRPYAGPWVVQDIGRFRTTAEVYYETISVCDVSIRGVLDRFSQQYRIVLFYLLPPDFIDMVRRHYAVAYAMLVFMLLCLGVGEDFGWYRNRALYETELLRRQLGPSWHRLFDWVMLNVERARADGNFDGCNPLEDPESIVADILADENNCCYMTRDEITNFKFSGNDIQS